MNSEFYKTIRSWVEVNLSNLRHNAKALQQIMPEKCRLMAVVKANAYGHSAVEVSRTLNNAGAQAFAVATVDEGIALRQNGITGKILILGFTDISRMKDIKFYDLIQTIIDFDYAKALNSTGVYLKTHLKIDTGMHRIGVSADDFDSVKQVFAMKNLDVCGIFTHLCCCDSLNKADVDYTNLQINRFYALLDRLKSAGIQIPKTHIQSSYGLLNYPQLECDYARLGIALYGVLSTTADTLVKPDLRPVLSVKSKIALLRNVKKGECVGYARAFTAQRNSKIAILPIGYADGISRSMSGGNGYVIIRNRRVPIAGRVCMDQLAVDVTDIEDVSVGDTAVLLGDTLPLPEAAERISSISNEILSRIGARLHVKFRDDEKEQ